MGGVGRGRGRVGRVGLWWGGKAARWADGLAPEGGVGGSRGWGRRGGAGWANRCWASEAVRAQGGGSLGWSSVGAQATCDAAGRGRQRCPRACGPLGSSGVCRAEQIQLPVSSPDAHGSEHFPETVRKASDAVSHSANTGRTPDTPGPALSAVDRAENESHKPLRVFNLKGRPTINKTSV